MRTRYFISWTRNWTSFTRDSPSADGEPYYPVPSPEAEELAAQYRTLAAMKPQMLVCGRLGRYQYLEMGQAVGSALAMFRKNLELLAP